MNIRINKYIYFGALFFSLGEMCAQNKFEVPEAEFRKDSVKIGEQIKLSLIYKHKPTTEFLFPDSSFNFFPFEFVKKDAFPTKTDSTLSVDSIVYTLTTFEMEPVLKLSLPVYIHAGGDTLAVFSNEAEVYLTEVITQTSGTDSLRVNTTYNELSGKWNYPYFAIGILAVALLVAIVFVFFRKSILKRYRLYLMKRDYEVFIKQFEKIVGDYNTLKSTTALELLLSHWKKYLQKLEKIPYTTLTTKEIAKIFDINQITSSLQNFDRAIYGGYVKEDLTNSIKSLLDTATARYQQKQKDRLNA